MDPSWKGKCSDRQETLISLNAFLHIPTTVVILYSRCVSCKTAHISLISRDMTDLFFQWEYLQWPFWIKEVLKRYLAMLRDLDGGDGDGTFKAKSFPFWRSEPCSPMETLAVAPSCDGHPRCVPVHIAVCLRGCCSPIGFFCSILFFILKSNEEIKSGKVYLSSSFFPLVSYAQPIAQQFAFLFILFSNALKRQNYLMSGF